MKTEKNILYCMTNGIPDENIKAQESQSPDNVVLFCGRRNGKTQIIKEFLETNYKTDADLVLGVARHCEAISKRGGDHAKEYHKIAQHLKKSAGHLLALERNGNT